MTRMADTSVPDGIDAPAVTEWLVANVTGLTAPLEFSLIAGGHSNLTYRVLDATQEKFVLRRPPLGHVLQSAHDMGREHARCRNLWFVQRRGRQRGAVLRDALCGRHCVQWL